MDIKQKYREETNLEPYTESPNYEDHFSNGYVKWLESKINNTSLKEFNINDCINEISIEANIHVEMFSDAGKNKSFRYGVKKAIDKMLFKN